MGYSDDAYGRRSSIALVGGVWRSEKQRREEQLEKEGGRERRGVGGG